MMMPLLSTAAVGLILSLPVAEQCYGLSTPPSMKTTPSRRQALQFLGTTGASVILGGSSFMNVANAVDTPNRMDVENFLSTGMVAQPMGVSGQAGKSKPVTGVVLLDGSEVSRDGRSGDVFAEILVKGRGSDDLMPVVATFSSPWPLATGTVYDVECRDPKFGDGAFLAVSPDIGEQSLADLKDSFFVKTLFSPTGRFSFYGTPTDIKVRKSVLDGNFRILDVSFSTLSQATQTEIPRLSRIVATVPNGSGQAVMLVGSASASRWKSGSEKAVGETMKSFQAVAAPKSAMKIRAKERRSS